jgi:anthranilate synthase component 2
LKVLLIDFYDSFTYNIYHYLLSHEVDVTVWEDKQVDFNAIERFDAIIFSPGPGLPSETYSMTEILRRYSSSKKILGICLGMQGIAEFFGGKLYNQKEVKHGVSTCINVVYEGVLFRQLPKKLHVGLYHSWAADISESELLVASSYSEENVLMSFEHVQLPIYGVQFHPESILSERGKELIFNFLVG